MNTKEEITNFFIEDGLLSKNFENYEFRNSQLEMALAVYETLINREHIFIEAPTGIGKSFAYLVPAIYYAKESNKKAVISTNTINLQEQLIHKDLPTLHKLLPLEFKSAIIKGKNNYLCPNRLEIALEKANTLFNDSELASLEEIEQWARRTNDGTLSDIEFPVDMNVWQSVCAEHGICTSKTCGPIETTKCFYQKAKHKLSEADIVIVNHHLFFTLFEAYKDPESDGYLFGNDFLIFDEAQTVENVASEHIVPSISRDMIKYHLNRLYNPNTKKGFLATFPELLTIIPIIENLLDLNKKFFQNIREKLFKNINEKKLAVRVLEQDFVDNILKDEIKHLTSKLGALVKYCRNDLEENELNDYRLKFLEFNILIDEFIKQAKNQENCVYWVELSSQKHDSNISLCVSPVDLSDYFRKNIFKSNNTCILTSATLSIKKSFDYFKNRLGGEVAKELILPTQFDFYNQVKIYIPKDIPPPPIEDKDDYYLNLKDWIYYFIKMTNGKALVLFTNSRALKKVADALREKLNEDNIPFYIQSEGKSRKFLLDRFKSEIDSVLFGLDSFWLGIDVPGEALTNLIITRLPFQVPDHPLIQAKMEYIDSKGGNSFTDYALPEAIFKFRQGIGRLIRNKTDKGIIAILDKRIISKPYGKQFLNSIDKCPISIITEMGENTIDIFE
ncbi:MAG: DEAD/DEAH box helicase [Ignavibacteria bacterium]|nr:DEAD/DEAH box helicase [Ignavibacteria bacterium]